MTARLTPIERKLQALRAARANLPTTKPPSRAEIALINRLVATEVSHQLRHLRLTPVKPSHARGDR